MADVSAVRVKLDPQLESLLEKMADETRHSSDAWGNRFMWCDCANASGIQDVAKLLAEHGARLCTVTALVREQLANPVLFLAYHFDVQTTTVTITVRLDPADNTVDTITPWFANADWNEREFAELYAIRVRGNANPKRLFLDPDIEQGVLNETIPLSVLMNGACTTDLWERIMTANQDTKPSSRYEGRTGDEA